MKSPAQAWSERPNGPYNSRRKPMIEAGGRKTATMELEFECSNVNKWKEALASYEACVESLNKPNLISLDDYYRKELPSLIHQRNPNPHINTTELSKLVRWKLTRGKWRPRLLDFVSSLDDSSVISASEKAFKSLPDLTKAVSELTVLKGVGPATASAVLAAYAPDVAPFMSDEVCFCSFSFKFTLLYGLFIYFYLTFVNGMEGYGSSTWPL